MPTNIWMCDSQKKLAAQSKMTCDWANLQEGRDKLIATCRANESGKALEREDFPPALYAQPHAKKRDYTFKDFFVANGLLVVSERLARLLGQFSLGNGSLFEVPLFEKDKSTPIEGKYFFLNIGNSKDAFLPDQSTHIEKLGGIDLWTIRSYQEAGNLAFSSTALSGPDIWADPRCMSVFFISERLNSEVRAKGLRGVETVECRTV